MANQFLALSLFIMLLSFFIVINAMSNFEEVKSRPVLNSISLAFSSKNLAEETAPSFEETNEQHFNDGDAIDQVEALFKAQITGHKVTKNSLGTVMHIRLPLRSFERGVGAAGEVGKNPKKAQRGAGGFFLTTLVSLLQARNTGIPYRMEMLLNMPRSPAETFNKSPRVVNEALQKVSGYAEQLEAAGLPRKLMSAGLTQGKDGYIDLYFRRYSAFNPLGNNKAGESGE
ncbi:MAG: hypothetical protein DHS20C02_01530 [Micavibrio sp.]|nr:MAG: hypothetical protein DHS20C02_01530 [Micavibrio sp.]